MTTKDPGLLACFSVTQDVNLIYIIPKTPIASVRARTAVNADMLLLFI